MQGQGRYTDDLNLPGQAYAVFVRSRNAPRRHQGHRHQRPRRAMPGVLAVYTGADLDGLRHAQMRRAVQEPRRLAR